VCQEEGSGEVDLGHGADIGKREAEAIVAATVTQNQGSARGNLTSGCSIWLVPHLSGDNLYLAKDADDDVACVTLIANAVSARASQRLLPLNASVIKRSQRNEESIK
jgi:hypothetical protein